VKCTKGEALSPDNHFHFGRKNGDEHCPRTRLWLSEIPLRVVELGGGRGSYSNEHVGTDHCSPRPATATATGSALLVLGSRATKWDRSVFYLASFSFSLHAIIDLTPHRPPTPRSACTNNPERLFSHAYSLPGPLRGAQSSTPLASIPNAILAFPQQSRTALRDYVERNPHAQGTTLYFLSPLDLCCMQCMVKPLQLRRNFSIAPTQRPRAESSFFHTGTALHVYKHGYKGPNPWSNLIK
jgi:hypothetical protein